MFNNPQTISSKLTENNTIEVVKRQPSNCMYACSPPKPVPDRVYKEIYGVVDGQIQLIETVEGKHEPSHQVNEKLIFEE
jgi:hypothetical protein